MFDEWNGHSARQRQAIGHNLEWKDSRDRRPTPAVNVFGVRAGMKPAGQCRSHPGRTYAREKALARDFSDIALRDLTISEHSKRANARSGGLLDHESVLVRSWLEGIWRERKEKKKMW